MSLVEGSSALEYTNEVANTLKVVSETTTQSAEIYSISNYLSETQADQPQAAMTTYKYVESLKTYVPQIVTGLTATASGAYTAVSGGLAYILSAPVAFAAMAGALGIGVGVGMYQLNPEFWTKVSNALVDAGAIVGNGVLAFMKDGKTYIPESTINIVRETLLNEGAYNSENYVVPSYDTTKNVRSDTEYSFTKVGSDIVWKQGSNYSFSLVNATGDIYALRMLSSRGESRVLIFSENSFFVKRNNQYLTSNKITYDNKAANYVMDATSNDDYFECNYDIPLQNFTVHSGTPKFYDENNNRITDFSENSGMSWLGLYGNYSPSGGVEGLSKQPGATIPSEQTTIPEEFPNWWSNGMEFLKPATREIGNAPTLNPDDYTTHRALPVEIPSTIGSPIEVGYNEPQITIQDGEIHTPSVDPPLDPPSVSWQRVINGVGVIGDPFPPENIDVYNEPNNPPVEDWTTNDPPTDPPVDPPTDDTGTTPPIVLPPIGGFGTGMNNVYNPTKSELQQFNAFLWSNNFVDTIKKILNDPMEAVIALLMVYCTPPTTSGGTIVVGTIDTHVSSDIVTNQFVTIDCGSVAISEYFLDYTDYSPYTEVIAYLPFIGFVNLEADDIIGSTVGIKYTVDLYTGTCLCEITVTKNDLSGVLYSFNGNCAVQLPLTAATHSSILGVLAGLSTAIASANPIGMVSGIAMAGLSAGKQSISRSGSLGSNAGAMGIKKPYILVRRPVAYNPQHYNKYYGIPSSLTVNLSEQKGFTRIKYVHVENIEIATDYEKSLIEDLLKKGVIIG